MLVPSMSMPYLSTTFWLIVEFDFDGSEKYAHFCIVISDVLWINLTAAAQPTCSRRTATDSILPFRSDDSNAAVFSLHAGMTKD